MNKQFHFKVNTEWNNGTHKNSKSHISQITGKPDLHISAAKEFKGDVSKHNPEDLQVIALSSCHMMSYFYVCQQNDIEIIDYKDAATGVLELKNDQSGNFVSVTLNPQVTLKNSSQQELALALHNKAHQLCFIANSVNFKVVINPKIICSL